MTKDDIWSKMNASSVKKEVGYKDKPRGEKESKAAEKKEHMAKKMRNATKADINDSARRKNNRTDTSSHSMKPFGDDGDFGARMAAHMDKK